MRRYCIGAALGIAALVLVSPVQAAGRGSRGSQGGGSHGSYHGVSHAGHPGRLHRGIEATPRVPPVINTWATTGGSSHGFKANHYPSQYGKKFSHGYYYPGKNHRHWSYTRWSSRYAHGYWCPYTRLLVLLVPVADCYYPMSYIPCPAGGRCRRGGGRG